ncbi:XTP/dITP diphosphatase [Fundidesulfovibrio putealis]|uniref:XTP/dITP diphosphatase n=1 Tax=Fundidesulfovibrio putealis TaxID=270496 RepID=UPI000428D2C1|nr:XTP/dITP diphosphatase [Fundidesulfovibrio putealis]
MTKVVLATRNQGKVRELQAMLEGQNIEVLGLDQFPWIGEVEETGATFEDNARLKAVAVSEATGLIALADDSGLVVDALEGEPGVRSARYAGDNATDADNNAKLLEAMKDVPDDKRACKFISALVVHAPDGHELVFHGVWFGRVAHEPSGTGGFGYDPLFFDPELKLSAAAMTPEQKNERSHRGRALREMMKYFPGFVETVEREAAMTPEQRILRDTYFGVKGWLKALCMLMMGGIPIFAAMLVSRNLRFIEALEAPGGPPRELAAAVATGLTLQNVLAVSVGFLIFWAGLSLYRRKKGALMFAKLAWMSAPLACVVEYVAAQFLNYTPEVLQMAEMAMIANALPVFVVSSACIIYLTFSRRVKATCMNDGV